VDAIGEELQALLTEHDIARITRRSVASVRRDRLLGRGCPYKKINGSVRYRSSDFQAWLEALPTKGAKLPEAK
jgi:hypothetical protein